MDVETFWSRVDKSAGPDSCWPWMGSRTNGAHGSMGVMGAHRFAFIVTYGDVLPGFVIMHLCHNPPCCNPSHLQVGSYSDNVRAMLARGRRPRRVRIGGWHGPLVERYEVGDILRPCQLAEQV